MSSVEALLWYSSIFLPACLGTSKIRLPFVILLQHYREFNATRMSTNDFSTLYMTLPHSSIKDILNDLIERTINSEGSPYLAFNDRKLLFLLWKA